MHTHSHSHTHTHTHTQDFWRLNEAICVKVIYDLNGVYKGEGCMQNNSLLDLRSLISHSDERVI